MGFRELLVWWLASFQGLRWRNPLSETSANASHAKPGLLLPDDARVPESHSKMVGRLLRLRRLPGVCREVRRAPLPSFDNGREAPLLCNDPAPAGDGEGLVPFAVR